jgi:hypothetical protein
MNHIDYDRLAFLTEKLNSGLASQAEKDEYMKMIYQNGSITQKQYQDYLNGRNTQDIVKAAIIIGGIILLGYLLGKSGE